MGQCICCVKLKRHTWRRSSQYRHKRFEFNPKRTRKFGDSAIRNEFDEMSIRNQDALDENLSPLSGATPKVVNGNQDLDEEDRGAGEVRMSGRLVFSDQWNDDATPTSLEPTETDPIVVDTDINTRDRSASINSEKMGRFEVWTLDEGTLDSEGNERSRLIDDYHNDM